MPQLRTMAQLLGLQLAMVLMLVLALASDLPGVNFAFKGGELIRGGNFGVDPLFFDAFNRPDNKPDPDCPPCFNCNLPNFECTQFSQCNSFTGMCECRPGYGSLDCSEPLCGSLADENTRRPVRKHHETCDCSPGWSGINCNVCTSDKSCDSFMPNGLAGTCHKSGIIVKSIQQMCDVTNPQIINILKGKKPQATFNCNKSSNHCDFQFWIDQDESFYCNLNECDFDYDLSANTTHYKCNKMDCKCLPGKMLCGQAGSIDISDFLTETIEGPGDFSCDINKKACTFSEPSMNDLIKNVFGDPYITLKCNSGECIHKSEIPGYTLPPPPKLTWGSIFLIASVVLISFLTLTTFVYNIRKSPLFKSGNFDIEDDDYSALNKNFTPITLSFENISYSVKNSKKLKNAFGQVKPKECLAIMGGSGAGKTTLLDILAGKNKDGEVSGSIYANGNVLNEKDYKKIVGFVDQEDHLIPTLTVYETVLNSALLRLPRDMTLRQKESRVVEVLNELRILHIKDSVIGSGFKRGISGGEKRRVSIACELVTSPSILFLDEPTSGLDSYNAKNVIESLVKLAKDYERTIVFTIHQPRSNIVSLFDQMILLSNGDLVYSGDAIKCNDYFGRNGYRCPLGYNLADYLIDITVDDRIPPPSESEEDIITDSRLGLVRAPSSIDTTQEWERFAERREEFNNNNQTVEVESKLADLFKESSHASELRNDIKDKASNSTPLDIKSQHLKRASITSQILILSSRTFKNLYRNPRLLFAHYTLSFLVGGFCGYLYYNVSNDISGFQNRLGFFFFVLAFLGFSSFTGLHSFSEERIIFIRERASNYYHPFSYYISKIFCDVLPLRVLPPVILASIAYPLVGLTMEQNGFLKCILTLILFNVTVTVEMLIVGILVKEPGTSIITAVLVLLLSLLFAGLFINSEDLNSQVRWLEWISLFHYAYEALAVNEVKDLMLREEKYGLSIEVPGATILSTFGFQVDAFWNDLAFLSGLFFIFLFLGYVFLHYFTIEKR